MRDTICTGELAGNLDPNLQKSVIGWRQDTSLNTSKRIKAVKTVCLQSNKTRNRMTRMTNGNRECKNNLKIIHWNMGAKLWENKLLEIQAVILKYKPDIYAVSEANLKLTLQTDKREIQGYKMYLPRTIEVHNHAKLVVLVREDLDVHIQNQHMDPIVAAIWMKITSKGRRSLNLGFVYREHQYIWEQNPTNSVAPVQQQMRWNMFVENWKNIARNADVALLGDLNLDHLTWDQPDHSHTRMIDKIKTDIETLGFNQMVEGVTRTWPGQPDTNLDHCWLNTPWRLIAYRNTERAFSDHNLIWVNLHMKYKVTNSHEFTRRDRTEINVNEYKNRIAQIDWTDFDNCENLEVLNDIFEKNILEVLDALAPLKTSQ